MDTSLCLLIASLLENTPDTPSWDTQLNALINHVLKRRRIIRPRPKRALDGIYLDTYQALRQALILKIGEAAQQAYSARSQLSEDGILSALSLTYQAVLTDERLTQLAVQVQQSTPRSPDQQYAVTELFRAIDLSQKLRHPSWRKQVTHQAYEDILNEVFQKAIEKIHTFDPHRSHFMVWMNSVMMGLRSIDIREKQKDTVDRAPHRRVMRTKYALSRTIRKTTANSLQPLLYFYCLKPIDNISQDACLMLSLTLGLLHQKLKEDAEKIGELLYSIAVAVVDAPTSLLQSLDQPRTGSDENSHQTLADTLPQAISAPPQIAFLRECILNCHQETCQPIFNKHLRGCPEATFRHIFLQRIEGKTWQEIGTPLGVGVPSVSNHIRRNLKHVTECLQNCVDDKVEQWKMLNPH